MSDSSEPLKKCATREEWLAARRLGVGSSDAAAILGLSPFASPLALYAEKLGVAEATEETEAMRWGSILEPLVAERYAMETDRLLVDPGRFTIRRSREHPFMLATLDREIVDGKEILQRGTYGVLEVKTTSAYQASEWAEEPPVYYQVQVQHQLAVMGWAWGSFAVLVGGQKFLWCDVERNDRFIALLIEREAEFIDRVARLAPPAAEAKDMRTVAALYPQDTGEIVTLPEEAAAWDRAYVEALGQLKHWTSIKNEAEARLKGAIASATVARLPGAAVEYRWTFTERKGYTVEPTSYRDFRRKERKP